jgi:hypothetical protein
MASLQDISQWLAEKAGSPEAQAALKQLLAPLGLVAAPAAAVGKAVTSSPEIMDALKAGGGEALNAAKTTIDPANISGKLSGDGTSMASQPNPQPPFGGGATGGQGATGDFGPAQPETKPVQKPSLYNQVMNVKKEEPTTPVSGSVEGPRQPTQAEAREQFLKEKEPSKGWNLLFQGLAGIGDAIAQGLNAGYKTNAKTDSLKNVIGLQKEFREELKKQFDKDYLNRNDTPEARRLQDTLIQSQGLKPDSAEAANLHSLSLNDLSSDPYKLAQASVEAKKQRDFQTSERLSSEKFQAGESAKQRAAELAKYELENAPKIAERNVVINGQTFQAQTKDDADQIQAAIQAKAALQNARQTAASVGAQFVKSGNIIPGVGENPQYKQNVAALGQLEGNLVSMLPAGNRTVMAEAIHKQIPELPRTGLGMDDYNKRLDMIDKQINDRLSQLGTANRLDLSKISGVTTGGGAGAAGQAHPGLVSKYK